MGRDRLDRLSGRGGDAFDTGTNSITLFWDGERWWVMGWMFDQAADAG